MLAFLKRIVSAPRPEMYGLDHAVLNMQLPPPTMWMNLGYWEVSLASGRYRVPPTHDQLTDPSKSTTDFTEACQALLDQVLVPGLLTDKSQSPRVLDVGCGCGDQSLYLTSLVKHDSLATETSTSDPRVTVVPRSAARSRTQHASAPPLIDNYIGVTIDLAQAELAKSRLRASDSASRSSAEIFCADAADPSSWPAPLKASVGDLVESVQVPNTATWLLALDTMYHFRPSRLPLLRYACSTLHASFMAFDLILADGSSWWERLLLRLVCWATGAPFSNFISQADYVQMLVAAGYDPSRIEVKDVSRHVFSGMSRFLRCRVQEAMPFGIKITKFSVASAVFNWWARSGMVRGVVIVARRN